MPKGAFSATLIATLALGYAGVHFALALVPVQPPSLPDLAGLRGAGEPDTVAAAQPWPAVFGTPRVAAPAPPPRAVVAPSTRYFLKGLIARTKGGWAVLTDGEAEILVQVDEVLEDGTRVVGIDRHGVTLDRDGVLTIVGFAADAPPAADAPGADPESGQDRAEIAAIPTSRTQFDITGLDPNDMTRILARAGAIEQIELADGGKVLDLLWIRNGLLFDKLGLQAGDRILQINGIDVGDDNAILRAASQLLSSDTYRIDILRNGERFAIEVEIIKNG